MTDPSSGRRGPPAAILLAWATFILIGWTGLLSPSLIRSIKDTFEQTDAGIGLYYFIYAVVYATGSLGGGLVTERLGRRAVLTLAATFVGVGLALMALAPGWELFLLAALPTGLGVGALDGGMNGLVLDLAPTGRGKALNLLHTFFSIGALSAPLVVGRLVEGGLEWTLIFLATGIVALAVALGLALVAMPDGRRGTEADQAEPSATEGGPARLVGGTLLTGPVILLSIAIGAYVASEVGHLELARALPRAGAALDRDHRALVVLGRARDRPVRVVPDRRSLRPYPLRGDCGGRDGRPVPRGDLRPESRGSRSRCSRSPGSPPGPCSR